MQVVLLILCQLRVLRHSGLGLLIILCQRSKLRDFLQCEGRARLLVLAPVGLLVRLLLRVRVRDDRTAI